MKTAWRQASFVFIPAGALSDMDAQRFWLEPGEIVDIPCDGTVYPLPPTDDDWLVLEEIIAGAP